MICIELSDRDAELFKQFRQYQDKFQTLLSHGVFEVKKGQAVLSFSAEGTLTNIDFQLRIK